MSYGINSEKVMHKLQISCVFQNDQTVNHQSVQATTREEKNSNK